MAGELLLDTRALISLLDRSQHRHVVFTEYFESWSDEVVTTEAVLTEAIHLLARVTSKAAALAYIPISPGHAAIRRHALAPEEAPDLGAAWEGLLVGGRGRAHGERRASNYSFDSNSSWAGQAGQARERPPWPI